MNDEQIRALRAQALEVVDRDTERNRWTVGIRAKDVISLLDRLKAAESQRQQIIALAAHAAGLTGKFQPDGSFVLNDDGGGFDPTTREGDAFRLAAKLGIDIRFCHSTGQVSAVNPWNGHEIVEPMGWHCMAVARVAAEIGKERP